MSIGIPKKWGGEKEVSSVWSLQQATSNQQAMTANNDGSRLLPVSAYAMYQLGFIQ
jgi:hypothetical protein